jgi:hypothetical protein
MDKIQQADELLYRYDELSSKGDARAEAIAQFAMITALIAIAEELHKMNERAEHEQSHRDIEHD